ncbi:MAG TPA: SMP-30/gluconolactonase/LRE family protein, partial [Sediminibacterium sp.]|nr:SMP-30/gluconolactonase/LRE family protein [Sediminibacterium sp.]
NKMIIGLKSGIAAIECINDNSQIEWLNKSFPNDPEQRLNDAKADKFGCIWFGSISTVDESRPIGKLMRLNLKTGNIEIIDEGYTVTNGPAFNQSQTIMLHNDSGRQITYRFDLDARTGSVINKTIWRKFSSEEGYPDGMSFDSNGHIWIAHWGVGRVVQYNLKGEVLLIVQLPVKNVTNICFGGAELNRLFVTSASSKLGDEFAKDCEYDGAVFEITGTNAKGFEGSLPII